MDKNYSKKFTVTAGVQPSSPTFAQLPHDQGTLTELQIVVPPGHAALTGIRILVAGVIIEPWGGSDWFIAADEIITLPYGEFINANQLSVSMYNTDIFDHSFYVRAKIAAVTQQTATPPQQTEAIGTLEEAGNNVDPLSPEALLSDADIASILSGKDQTSNTDLAGVT